MKKENSLNFFNLKCLMVIILALGFVFLSNSNVTAQNSIYGEKVPNLIELRNTFAPSSAKYDIVQDAINYLRTVDQNYGSTENGEATFADPSSPNPFEADVVRKVNPIILKEYTQVELDEIKVLLEGFTSGENQNSIASKKARWILEANAY